MPTLKKFISLMKSGHIRNDLGQCAGWLIFLGAVEYREYNPEIFDAKEPEEIMPKDWKIGSIEPTTGIHGDIEFAYVIDLEAKEIEIYECQDKEDEYRLINEKGENMTDKAVTLYFE